MWRAGFDLALFAWIINAVALAFGAGLGVRGLFDPHWAARFVRLKADAESGGFAEFRATYGGFFAFSHAAALLLTLRWIMEGGAIVGIFAAGAAVPLSAAWAGACGGRLISMWRGGARTRFNALSAGVEGALALAIGLPWIVWVFRTPG